MLTFHDKQMTCFNDMLTFHDNQIKQFIVIKTADLGK
jgi:hypothetical protein